jgi:hypothetical protein
MEATPRARALAVHVSAALAEVQATLKPQGAFSRWPSFRRYSRTCSARRRGCGSKCINSIPNGFST